MGVHFLERYSVLKSPKQATAKYGYGSASDEVRRTWCPTLGR